MPGALAEIARRVRADACRVVWPSARWREDPVGFCRQVLGIEPWDKQIEILEAIRDHKRVAVRSGHKCGKSTTAAIAALWFFCSFPDARVVMTCVTSRQVDAILYREVRKLHARAGHCVSCVQASAARVASVPQLPPLPKPCEHSELARTGLKSEDFRELVGFTAREAEAVAGTSGPNILYLPDEASGIPRAIFEAIEGNRAGGNARLAMFSNPTQTDGVFFEAFEDPKVSPLYKQIHVSSEDTPNVREGRAVIPGLADREWVEEKKIEWGEDSPLYRVRVKGEFVRNEEGRIISLHLLEQAEKRWIDTPETGRLQVGVDPAGPGIAGDETTFCARRGQRQTELVAMRDLTAEAIVVHLVDFLRAHRKPREVPIVCIDREGPIGSQLLGLLRAYLDSHPDAFELYGIRSSDKAHRDPMVYGTVRDELWANAAQWLREGGAVREDVKLTKELHAPMWISVIQYGSNKLKATDKKELRKALDRSPDRADAFCLSVWEPQSLTLQTDAGAVPVAAQALDPYDDVQERELAVDRVFDPYGGRS